MKDESALLRLLYPIADVLCFDIFLNVKVGQTPRIKFTQSMDLALTEGAKLPFECRAVASAVLATEAWVLFKVAGCLYALVGYDKDAQTVHLWVLDGSGGTYAIFASVSDYNMGMLLGHSLLGDFVKARYVRKLKEEQWERVDVDRVDAGQHGTAEEGHSHHTPERGDIAPGTGHRSG